MASKVILFSAQEYLNVEQRADAAEADAERLAVVVEGWLSGRHVHNAHQRCGPCEAFQRAARDALSKHKELA